MPRGTYLIGHCLFLSLLYNLKSLLKLILGWVWIVWTLIGTKKTKEVLFGSITKNPPPSLHISKEIVTAFRNPKYRPPPSCILSVTCDDSNCEFTPSWRFSVLYEDESPPYIYKYLYVCEAVGRSGRLIRPYFGISTNSCNSTLSAILLLAVSW